MKSNPQQILRPYFRGRLAVAAMALSCLTASAARADLKHLYTFNDNTANDSVGTANGTVVDPGDPSHSFLFGKLDLTNNPNELSNEITEAAYVDLPNGVVTDAVATGTDGAVAFEFWASVSEARTWNRLGDFGTSNDGEDQSPGGDESNYLMITPNSGRVGGDGLEITANLAGDEPNVQDNNMGGDPVPYGLNVEHQVVAVYDQTDNAAGGTNGSFFLYKDGEFIGQNAIPDGFDLHHPDDGGNLDDNNNWLGRSQWNDPTYAGTFNEFRIYDHALTAEEVMNRFAEGPEFTESMVLDVSTSTGNMRLRNASSETLNIDFYQINSEGGSLDPDGWNSLDAQNVDAIGAGDGESWDVSGGGESANTLAELFLLGNSTLSSGETLHLGAGFDTTAVEDLEFQFSLASGQTDFGSVAYTDDPLDPMMGGDENADFNSDGVVDGADFLIQQRNWETGTTQAEGDANDDGAVNGADLAIWESQFGGPPPVAAASAAAPEPGAIVLAAISLALVAGGMRMRRR